MAGTALAGAVELAIVCAEYVFGLIAGVTILSQWTAPDACKLPAMC